MWRCFDKRSHVEKHSFSLTFSLSPLIIPPQDKGEGGTGGDGGEMTFSFVLLRAPYYHLS